LSRDKSRTDFVKAARTGAVIEATQVDVRNHEARAARTTERDLI